MKKIYTASFIYFLQAMAGGVFYREFTKIFNFTGITTLSYVHVHFLVLGTFLFLLLLVLAKNFSILDSKWFSRFFIVYNIGLPVMVGMFILRGILQVTGSGITSGMNGMIAGIGGVSHILLFVALCMMFASIKQAIKEAK